MGLGLIGQGLCLGLLSLGLGLGLTSHDLDFGLGLALVLLVLALALAIGGLTLHVRASRSCSKRSLSTLQHSVFLYE